VYSVKSSDRSYVNKIVLSSTLRFSFVDQVNEVTSVVTFLQILNLPVMLCVTGFHMTQVIFKSQHFLYKQKNNLAVSIGSKVRCEVRVPSFYD
jgi:hypothetical protein